MRLIDENEVKELLLGLDSLPWEEEVDGIVDRIPTAYSVEAVVRELEAARKPHKEIADGKGWSNRDRVHAIGIVGAYNHAIEIVKRGGRNE